MPKEFKIEAKHSAGGINLSAGDFNLKEEENVESRNMTYAKDGEAVSDGGYGDIGVDWGEDDVKIDGLHNMSNYPDLLFAAVNGKIKYVDLTTKPLSSATVYECDTGLSLTAGERVFFDDYRGMLYYANGTEVMGRIAVAKLDTAITPASTTIELEDDTGYKFNNATDKVYIEDDEIDYTAVSTDDLTTVTNIDANHAKNTYVTQHNTLTAPGSGSLKASSFAFFRDTMFYTPKDEVNVLRYGKTVSSVSTIGNIHDFSDGNNYLIGEGGELTALLGTRDRLYIFMNDRVHYIGIETTAAGVESFTPDRLFTGNYGAPNAFCVEEMEDVIVFFAGDRFVRIGYDPSTQQLLPDNEFDSDILPILEGVARYSQSDASLIYNRSSKKLLCTVNDNGLLKTIVYDNHIGDYSFSFDHDTRAYAVVDGKMYFGSNTDDVVYLFGDDIDANGFQIEHAYTSGRYDKKVRTRKFFRRGMIEGHKAVGTVIRVSFYVNGDRVGNVREITDEHMDSNQDSEQIGSKVFGSSTIGGGAATTLLRPYRFPFSLGKKGEDFQIEMSTITIGAAWTVSKWHVNGVIFDDNPYKHY